MYFYWLNFWYLWPI